MKFSQKRKLFIGFITLANLFFTKASYTNITTVVICGSGAGSGGENIRSIFNDVFYTSKPEDPSVLERINFQEPQKLITPQENTVLLLWGFNLNMLYFKTSTSLYQAGLKGLNDLDSAIAHIKIFNYIQNQFNKNMPLDIVGESLGGKAACVGFHNINNHISQNGKVSPVYKQALKLAKTKPNKKTNFYVPTETLKIKTLTMVATPLTRDIETTLESENIRDSFDQVVYIYSTGDTVQKLGQIAHHNPLRAIFRASYKTTLNFNVQPKIPVTQICAKIAGKSPNHMELIEKVGSNGLLQRLLEQITHSDHQHYRVDLDNPTLHEDIPPSLGWL